MRSRPETVLFLITDLKNDVYSVDKGQNLDVLFSGFVGAGLFQGLEEKSIQSK